MSKRLRASMRAANKGRNLRPRASQPHEQGTTPSEPPPSGRDSETPSSTRESAPETAPSLDLRARETVREPSVAPEPAPAAKVEAKPELVAKVEPATPPEPARGAGPVLEIAPGSATAPSKPSTESGEPKQPSSSTAAQVPPPDDSFKAGPVKSSPPAQTTSKGSGDAAREKPAVKEEVPLLATTLRTEQPKAAPVAKAAPSAVAETSRPSGKTNDPKKGQPAAAKKGDESKKAAPAKAEDPRSLPSNKKLSSTKEAEPGSRRPASLRAVPALDDDLDPSSISSAFFRKDQDSVPPVEEHEDHELSPVPVLSPSTLARRARLRRLVAGVVAFAGVISIAVVGKQVSASKRPISATTALVADAKPSAPEEVKGGAPPPAEPAKTVAATEPAKVEMDAKPIDKKADEPAKVDEAKKDEPKADEVKKDEPKADDAKKADDKPAPSASDAAALKKETLSLLNRGRTKDAIAKAREGIAADPSDADLYLYLGSALQDSGKWKDGIEAYSDCVRNATKGPVHECRAMGGHK